MEKVMVVCGGQHQIPLVKKVKELGYEVLCTNLYLNSPCFEFADKTEVIDVLNKEENLNFAKNNCINAVVSDQSEISIKTVAYVAEKMGIAGITLDTAKLFTDKYRMRELCRNNGFPTPEYCICEKVDDALAFYDKHNFKMIIKPIDSFSSKGVFSIERREEIIAHFNEAILYSEQKKVIIEEYINGTEFTIDAIVANHEVYNLAISEKKHYDYNENIAKELMFSYSNQSYDYDILRQTNYKILKSSGISFGLTHCEYKYYNNKFYLIEMTSRGGGVYIGSKIVPFVSGVDNYRIYIESALGHRTDSLVQVIDETVAANKNKVAKLAFLDIVPNGKRVKRVNGLDTIKANPNVMAFEIDVKENDVIKLATCDSNRIGYYIITADNINDLMLTEQMIKENLMIDYYE